MQDKPLYKKIPANLCLNEKEAKPCTPLHLLRELEVFFSSDSSKEKRVEGIVVPTDESKELLEDYLSRWSWIVVQRLSDPGTVKSDFAPEDAEIPLQDAVLENVLYGIAYLAARRNAHTDDPIQAEEGADETQAIGPGDVGELLGRPISLAPFSAACKRFGEIIDKMQQDDLDNGIERPAGYLYRVPTKDIIGDDACSKEDEGKPVDTTKSEKADLTVNRYYPDKNPYEEESGEDIQ